MYADMTVSQSYFLFKSLLFYTRFVQKQQRVALARSHRSDQDAHSTPRSIPVLLPNPSPLFSPIQ